MTCLLLFGTVYLESAGNGVIVHQTSVSTTHQALCVSAPSSLYRLFSHYPFPLLSATFWNVCSQEQMTSLGNHLSSGGRHMASVRLSS